MRASRVLSQFGGVLLLGLGLRGTAALPQYPPSQAPEQPGQPGVRPFGGRGFGMRDGVARILPPGLWWKSPDLVQQLELTADQQRRIDDLFAQNRITLSRMHAALDQEQSQMEPLLNASPVDDGRVLAEVDKIVDMRADLEKATAKMLLQMRGVLTQTQWAKLQQSRPAGMHQHMYVHGPEGGPPSRGRTDPSLGEGFRSRP